MRRMMSCLGVSAAAGLVMLAMVVQAADEKKADTPKAEKITADKLPKKVMDSVKARFPGAELTSIEKELEDGKIVYDIELKHQGRKYEMDIHEDGTVVEIEKEVAMKDVPQVVKAVVEAKYPKSKIEEVMEVNKVKGKEEKPDHYEVVIETADKKKIELEVSLDGKVIKGGASEEKK